MNANEYQTQAARTIGCKNKIDMGIHGVLGFMAECGEYELAAEAFENLAEIDPKYNPAKELVIKEAGDIWWMIAELATANDFPLEVIMTYPSKVAGWFYPSKELCGVYQKHFQGHEIDRTVVLELLAEMAQSFKLYIETFFDLGVTISEIWEKNIEKLKARYPEGFDSEKSLHRAEGDV